MRMHTGVDWAAPAGTPILAAGDGTVEQVGGKGGYGNYIRIRHANGFTTAYGHMSRYADGVAPGVAVKQGQVIGYVGSTGCRPARIAISRCWSTPNSSTR